MLVLKPRYYTGFLENAIVSQVSVTIYFYIRLSVANEIVFIYMLLQSIDFVLDFAIIKIIYFV